MGDDLGRLEANVDFLASRYSYLAAKSANDALAAFGLSTKTYALLELASVTEGKSQREIGRILLLDPSRVVRLVDALAERGLVERVRSTADRRVTLIHATPDGAAIAADAAAALERASAALHAALSDDELAELRRLLTRLGSQG